jgi:hypothetical protein
LAKRYWRDTGAHGCRARRFDVLFSRADVLVKALAQACVDHTVEKHVVASFPPDG